jgi:integrase
MLTDVRLRNAKAKDKAYKLTDGRGLYVLVTPNGSKLFHLRYTFEGRERLMAMGTIGLADARRRAEDARADVAAGRDPLAAKIAEKTARKVAADNSFESVARGWYKDWSRDISPRHAVDTLSRLEGNVFPVIGAKPITEVDASMISDMARSIERKGDRTEMARRMLEACGQVFRFAIVNKLATRNPAVDVKPGDILRRHKVTNYARIDGRDLGKLLRDIENYRGTPITRMALKLMTLTFVRTGELIGARWSEFTLAGDTPRWDIPAERMKMDTPHIVPLSRQAVDVLAQIRELSGDSEYLFPGDRKNQTMSNNTLLKALERMGYKGEMTGHGFRGLASTLLHEQGIESEFIEAQLAHQKRNKVSAAYNHAKYLIQRREMMQKWADYCDGERTKRGQVFEMKTA